MRGPAIKRAIALGIAVAALGVGAALGQTSVDGLDLEAIDKRAKAGAADLSQFVSEVLHAQGKANDEQRATVEGMVNTATNKVAALHASPGLPNTSGVDLDRLASEAGQAMKPEARTAPTFIAFASLSMPPESLQRMIADVSKAGGIVVFRGFSPGGGRAFMEQLRKVVPQGEPAHISIDPRLFSAYRIDAVPTYVAASTSFTLCSAPDCTNQPMPHDRLAGNVTTRFALETFADGKGPGAPVATKALASLGGGE
jgi:conjugal transfer pilus assembly protein TrbC